MDPVDIITFEDRERSNERLYRHIGCWGWMCPMDDTAKPTGIMECAECAESFPVLETTTERRVRLLRGCARLFGLTLPTEEVEVLRLANTTQWRAADAQIASWSAKVGVR